MESPLDQVLRDNGFPAGSNDGKQIEGYMTESQKVQFCERLSTYSNISKVAEVGLNAGHSAENFLKSIPSIQRFVSFDLNFYKYTPFCVEYLQKEYPQQFHFVEGHSAETIPLYAQNHPKEKFDLIYIDANHLYESVVKDLLNCAKIARPSTILWMDDYHYTPVFLAVHEQARKGLIEIINIHDSYDLKGGERSWVEAKYLNP